MPRADSADVLIVGGGPSGSTTGILLARRGWQVTIVDRARFPRPKACGETLNPGAVELLRTHGLLDPVLAAHPSSIPGWSIGSRGTPVLEVEYTRRRSSDDQTAVTPTTALGIPRTVLDAVLLREAERAGVQVIEGLNVTSVEEESDVGSIRVRGRAHGARSDSLLSPRYLVGADGLRSRVARAIEAPATRPRGGKLSLSARLAGVGPSRSRGYLRVDGGLTVGVAPVAERQDLWNVTVVVDARRDAAEVREDPRGFLMRRLLDVELGWESPPSLLGEPLASGPFDRPVRWAARGRIVLVGDAAGYYDPLTGQGIYRALRTAEIATAHLHQLLGGAPEVPQSYSEALEAEFKGGRRVQWCIEHALRHHPTRVAALSGLRAASPVARELLRWIGDVPSSADATTESDSPPPPSGASVHAHSR